MKKNVIAMMFDSLQFTYLGCYGNTWIKTPNMDRLAKEGVLFENNYSEGVPTLPCRRAMQTGRYTLPVAGWVPLSPKDTTIADLCWGRPIETALMFDCANYRLPKFGYTRGFDKVWFTHGQEGDDYFYADDELTRYNVDDFINAESAKGYEVQIGTGGVKGNRDEVEIFLKLKQRWKSPEDHTMYRTINSAISYLKDVDRTKQFFLWIDCFDPHEPWFPPSVINQTPCPYDPDYKGCHEPYPMAGLVDGVYTEAQLNHFRMLYAETVTLCDEALGKLLDTVRDLGLEENTLFLLLSDHGKPMGNGEHGHGIVTKCRPWPYEELVHTPLIIRGPGLPKGKRISAFTQSVDICPTICEWLGIPIHPLIQGKSLLPLIRGEVDKLHDFAIAGYFQYGWSIITEDWSYIHWMKEDSKTDDTMNINYYFAEIDDSHLRATGGKGYMQDYKESYEEAFGAEYVEERKNSWRSLDGADQWTCARNSLAEVPGHDELYDRRKDPFQLHNVLEEHPDVAKKLLTKLVTFMEDLKADAV